MVEQIPGQMELEEYLRVIGKDNFDIAEHIPTGSENAISRKNLMIKTGLTDRQMRRLIHFARRKIPIINLQNGCGYFIPDMNIFRDRLFLIRYVRQEESRLKRLAWSLFSARKVLKNCGIDWRDEKYGRKKNVLKNNSGLRCVS